MLAKLFNSKACRLVTDLTTDTAVLFAVGDLVMAFHKAELTGVITNLAVTAATIGLRAYKSLTGQGAGLSYLPVTLNQAWTGGSLLVQGARDFGSIGALFTSGPEATKTLMAFAIYALSVPAGFLLGWQDAHGKPEGGPIKKALLHPLTWLGVGSIIATFDFDHWERSWALPFFIMAMMRQYTNKPQMPMDPTSITAEHPVGAFIHKEVINPGHLCRAGWLVGAWMLRNDPFFLFAYSFWGAGYPSIDSPQKEEQAPVANTAIPIPA